MQWAAGHTSVPVPGAGSPGSRSLWRLESGDWLCSAPVYNTVLCYGDKLSVYLPLCLFWFVLLLRTVSVLLSPCSAAQLRGHPGERGGCAAEQGPCPGPSPRCRRSRAAGPAIRPDPCRQELCRPATSHPPLEPCCCVQRFLFSLLSYSNDICFSSA